MHQLSTTKSIGHLHKLITGLQFWTSTSLQTLLHQTWPLASWKWATEMAKKSTNPSRVDHWLTGVDSGGDDGNWNTHPSAYYFWVISFFYQTLDLLRTWQNKQKIARSIRHDSKVTGNGHQPNFGSSALTPPLPPGCAIYMHVKRSILVYN